VKRCKAYFAAVDPADGAWAAHLFVGKTQAPAQPEGAWREIAMAPQLCRMVVRRLPAARWGDSGRNHRPAAAQPGVPKPSLIERRCRVMVGAACRRSQRFEFHAPGEACSALGGSCRRASLPVQRSCSPVALAGGCVQQEAGDTGPGAAGGPRRGRDRQRSMGGLEPAPTPSAPCFAPLTERGRAGESA